MRKSLLAVVLIIGLALSGCAGWQIGDDANSQAIAYASGKGVGIAINQYVPKADGPLSEAWGRMMAAHAGQDVIPAEDIIDFYMDSVTLLSSLSKDPYGLISDLTFFLSIYGGSITSNGQLTLAQPIPMRVAKAFEMGYKSGKSAIRAYAETRAVP